MVHSISELETQIAFVGTDALDAIATGCAPLSQ
jgi:hypothetical protein